MARARQEAAERLDRKRSELAAAKGELATARATLAKNEALMRDRCVECTPPAGPATLAAGSLAFSTLALIVKRAGRLLCMCHS